MQIARMLAALAVTLSLTACQTTSIQSAWYDTSYKAGPFRKIVVIASDGTTADSRVFEDIFVQKLHRCGRAGRAGLYDRSSGCAAHRVDVRACRRGHRRRRRDPRAPVARRHQDAGLDVMMPGPMMGPWGGFYGPGFYGGGFYGGGFYAAPEVTQYDVASVETNVYDVNTKTLVWAATTQTVNPTTVAKEAPNYADLIIAQLRARNLLPAGK